MWPPSVMAGRGEVMLTQQMFRSALAKLPKGYSYQSSTNPDEEYVHFEEMPTEKRARKPVHKVRQQNYFSVCGVFFPSRR